MTETIELQITGMTCGHCERTVTRVLQSLPGVRAVAVRRSEGRAFVEHDATPLPAMQQALAAEGFGARLAEAR